MLCLRVLYGSFMLSVPDLPYVPSLHLSNRYGLHDGLPKLHKVSLIILIECSVGIAGGAYMTGCQTCIKCQSLAWQDVV